MKDAGADTILDFVDVGLPTTILDPDEYRRHLRVLLTRLQRTDDEIVVVETGASPLEAYNGDVAIQEIHERVMFTVACASDPYAVLGLLETFHPEVSVDVIAGITTNTEAGVELVENLVDLPALNLHTERGKDRLKPHLQAALP